MKITDVLILLCIVTSLYAWSTGTDLAFSVNALLNGEYYPLITAIFVHANLLHLVGNMIFLYIFGSYLENDVGAKRTALVFMTGGVLSFIFSIPFYPGAEMLGASAAIFSVMAALVLVRRPGFSFEFLSPAGPIVIFYLIFNIFSIKNGATGNVAYLSHVIGFLIGALFGAKWNKKWVESLVYTLILLAVYILIYNYLKNMI